LAGHSTVAFSMSTATGFRSLLTVPNPKRAASKGILPPPAVGSKTRMLASFSTFAASRSHSRSSAVGQ
jgi:hypothetical protein